MQFGYFVYCRRRVPLCYKRTRSSRSSWRSWGRSTRWSWRRWRCTLRRAGCRSLRWAASTTMRTRRQSTRAMLHPRRKMMTSPGVLPSHLRTSEWSLSDWLLGSWDSSTEPSWQLGKGHFFFFSYMYALNYMYVADSYALWKGKISIYTVVRGLYSNCIVWVWSCDYNIITFIANICTFWLYKI